MTNQKARNTEISAKTQAYAKSSAKYKSSKVKFVARGAGFEPARPKGPQAQQAQAAVLPLWQDLTFYQTRATPPSEYFLEASILKNFLYMKLELITEM